MQILGIFLCMVFLIDLLTYPYQKSFPKKSVLKIFKILFEKDCPEAVVHVQSYNGLLIEIRHTINIRDFSNKVLLNLIHPCVPRDLRFNLRYVYQVFISQKRRKVNVKKS